MKKIHNKIEYRKRAIAQKKKEIDSEWRTVKDKFGSATSLSITALGGFVLGFLFLPKKAKLLKLIFKAYGVAMTTKQLLDLLPEKTEHKETTPYRKDVH